MTSSSEGHALNPGPLLRLYMAARLHVLIAGVSVPAWKAHGGQCSLLEQTPATYTNTHSNGVTMRSPGHTYIHRHTYTHTQAHTHTHTHTHAHAHTHTHTHTHTHSVYTYAAMQTAFHILIN